MILGAKYPVNHIKKILVDKQGYMTPNMDIIPVFGTNTWPRSFYFVSHPLFNFFNK